VDDWLLLKTIPPELGQSFALDVSQAWGKAAQMELPAMLGKTLTACGGVPICTAKEDHKPSLPSLALAVRLGAEAVLSVRTRLTNARWEGSCKEKEKARR
jgi:hypothetical protein